jgi:hypothetical protein
MVEYLRVFRHVGFFVSGDAGQEISSRVNANNLARNQGLSPCQFLLAMAVGNVGKAAMPRGLN